jgi:hypothetical protein
MGAKVRRPGECGKVIFGGIKNGNRGGVAVGFELADKEASGREGGV